MHVHNVFTGHYMAPVKRNELTSIIAQMAALHPLTHEEVTEGGLHREFKPRGVSHYEITPSIPIKNPRVFLGDLSRRLARNGFTIGRLARGSGRHFMSIDQGDFHATLWVHGDPSSSFLELFGGMARKKPVAVKALALFRAKLDSIRKKPVVQYYERRELDRAMMPLHEIILRELHLAYPRGHFATTLVKVVDQSSCMDLVVKRLLPEDQKERADIIRAEILALTRSGILKAKNVKLPGEPKQEALELHPRMVKHVDNFLRGR